MRPLPLFALLLAACTTWEPVTTPTPLDSTTRLRGNVRVTVMGGQTKIGNDPFVREGYLILRRGDGSIDSVHVGRVVLIERSVTDDRRSFIITAAVVAVLVAVAVAFANGYSPGAGALGS